MLKNLLEFKSDTAKDPSYPNRGRGANILQVDVALEAYWTGKNSNVTIGTELALLAGVIKACQRWLKIKMNKNEYKKIFGIQTDKLKPLFARRRLAIKSLGDSAVEEYFGILERTGMLTWRERGRMIYDRKKFRTLGSKREDRRGVKSLDRSYQPEKQSYMQSGKVRAIPGAGVGQVFTMYDQRQHLIKRQRELGQQVTTNMDSFGGVMHQLRKGMDNLTVEDYQILDDFARNGDFMLYEDGGVQYLKRDERMQYMVVNDGDGGMEYIDGREIPGRGEELLYAMDSYGVLYSRENPQGLVGYSHFNHSSIRSGGEVICAGMLQVENKQLVMINNMSGHYKPTRDHLHNCLEVLAADGIDLAHARVEVLAMIGGTLKKQHHDRALDFLQARTRQPDRVEG